MFIMCRNQTQLKIKDYHISLKVIIVTKKMTIFDLSMPNNNQY